MADITNTASETTGSSGSESDGTLERTVRGGKVDRRKTGGLENRSPAQKAAFERMRAGAAAKAEAARKAKVEEGLKLLALEEETAQDDPPPAKPSRRKPKPTKSTRGPGVLVFDQRESSGSSSDDDEPAQTIVIKTSRRRRTSSRKAREPSPDPPAQEPAPAPFPPIFNLKYV